MPEPSLTSARFCIGCRYNLTATETNRCPECGRAFDPADSETYDIHAGRRGAIVQWIAWLGMLYPIALVGLLYAAWFAAWLELGHPPRSSLDDPKSLGPAVEIPGTLWFLLLFGMPLGLGLSILAPTVAHHVGLLRSPIRRLGRPIPFMLWTWLAWAFAITVLNIDPLRIIEWIFD